MKYALLTLLLVQPAFADDFSAALGGKIADYYRTTPVASAHDAKSRDRFLDQWENAIDRLEKHFKSKDRCFSEVLSGSGSTLSSPCALGSGSNGSAPVNAARSEGGTGNTGGTGG